MHRLDTLRLSLLAGLTGCLVVSEDEGAEGHTTTTMGSSTSDDNETNGETNGETTTADTTTEDTSESNDDDIGEECPPACENPVELADGIVQCPDGRINRVAEGTFDPTIDAPSCAGTEEYLQCTSDADCPGTSGNQGKCISAVGIDFELGTEYTYCGCAYSCASDSDCEPGGLCLPPNVLPDTPTWPTCMYGGCTTASDCADCGECGLGAHQNECGWNPGAQCRMVGDSCTADDQCADFEYCFPFGGLMWSCGTEFCGIGRPLLVDDRPCTAPPQPRREWATLANSLDEIPADPQLAAHWAQIAALEHASVASFARFGMQLLALGAPPRLLRACKQAAHDEVVHAQLAYALASAYGREPIGPGQLNLHNVAFAASWREVVRGLIVEACVGETLGVAEAMTAAEHAQVPAVRAVLERIAADELRHAQLAWQSLAWLLGIADERDRAWALALLDRTIAAVGEPHRDARERVLTPLARALA
jgi:hypothetical protein